MNQEERSWFSNRDLNVESVGVGELTIWQGNELQVLMW